MFGPASTKRTGSVELDLGGGPRNGAWAGLIIGGLTAAVGAGASLVNPWFGALLIVWGFVVAGAMMALALRAHQALCENGIQTLSEFIPWRDLSSYRFWDLGIDLNYRTSVPLNAMEMSTILSFPLETRPEVQRIVGERAPKARQLA